MGLNHVVSEGQNKRLGGPYWSLGLSLPIFDIEACTGEMIASVTVFCHSRLWIF